MELMQLLMMMQKRIVFIIVVPILAAIGAAVVSCNFMTPLYEASSSVYIVNQNDNVSGELLTYQELLTNQQLVSDYRELIRSKMITKEVIGQLKINDISPSKLISRITVNSKNDTRVLVIRVIDTDPVRAKNLADKIGQVLEEKSGEYVKANNVKIVDEAEVPTSPIKPRPLVNTAIAFLLGLFSTVGLIVFIEYINDTIKTREDVETIMGINVLGTIPLFNIK